MVQAISVNDLYPTVLQVSTSDQTPTTYLARHALVLQLRAEPLCEHTFRKWGELRPEQLTTFLETDTRLGYLARAALVARDVPQAREALVALVDHPNAAIQEAAVMALEGHPSDVVERLLRNVADDPSRRPGVRDAAVAVLDVMCD